MYYNTFVEFLQEPCASLSQNFPKNDPPKMLLIMFQNKPFDLLMKAHI